MGTHEIGTPASMGRYPKLALLSRMVSQAVATFSEASTPALAFVDQNPSMNAQHHQCCPSLGLSPFEMLAACVSQIRRHPRLAAICWQTTALTQFLPHCHSTAA